jgi:hypothetical protein
MMGSCTVASLPPTRTSFTSATFQIEVHRPLNLNMQVRLVMKFACYFQLSLTRRALACLHNQSMSQSTMVSIRKFQLYLKLKEESLSIIHHL